MRRTYGYTFYMLIVVTEGQGDQMLDFEPCPGGVGSMVLVRPGQAHTFGQDEEWDGWILLVRPDFLWSTSTEAVRVGFDMKRLPTCIRLNSSDLERTVTAMEWMRQDAACAEANHSKRLRDEASAPAEIFENLQSHLRYAFYGLVSWLAISYGDKGHNDQPRGPSLRRFYDFKDLVEQHLVEWKSISSYARAMRCTERSLTRAAVEAEGISAKEYVSRRLGLEAKRLLIHTDWPVGVIAEKLGFKEATHFSKFFRRVAGCTPQQFRSLNGHG
jgi:AraC-like DNA-binding protein